MQRRSFKDVLTEMSLAYPAILKRDGSINGAKVAELMQRRGFNVQQPTISRLLNNPERIPDPNTVNGLVATFGSTGDFWRGEAPNRPVKLGNAEIPMVCIVLAERILALPYEARLQLDAYIELHEKTQRNANGGPDAPQQPPATVATLNPLKARRASPRTKRR